MPKQVLAACTVSFILLLFELAVSRLLITKTRKVTRFSTVSGEPGEHCEDWLILSTCVEASEVEGLVGGRLGVGRT